MPGRHFCRRRTRRERLWPFRGSIRFMSKSRAKSQDPPNSPRMIRSGKRILRNSHSCSLRPFHGYSPATRFAVVGELPTEHRRERLWPFRGSIRFVGKSRAKSQAPPNSPKMIWPGKCILRNSHSCSLHPFHGYRPLKHPSDAKRPFPKPGTVFFISDSELLTWQSHERWRASRPTGLPCRKPA